MNKTLKAAAKRFKISGRGTVMRRKAKVAHNMRKEDASTSGAKKRNRAVSKQEQRKIKNLLGKR